MDARHDRPAAHGRPGPGPGVLPGPDPSGDGDALRAAREGAYENPRPEVARVVPVGARRILDLGCASGALGAALGARGPREVVGIERDPVYAERARSRLDRVETVDLETAFATREAARAVAGDAYDCVVAADVLEHLREPWVVLESAVALLRPGGTLVVSLPNVRHWETFWTLLRHGTWPRREVGLFDATHLRWFTLGDAVVLLERAGAPVASVERDVTRVMRARPSRPSRLDPWLARAAPPGLRALLAYQHVLVGKRAP